MNEYSYSDPIPMPFKNYNDLEQKTKECLTGFIHVAALFHGKRIKSISFEMDRDGGQYCFSVVEFHDLVKPVEQTPFIEACKKVYGSPSSSAPTGSNGAIQ